MSGRAKLFAISLTVVLGLFSGSGEAANLVVNGNFSSGNTGFDTDYTFVSAPNPPAPPCAPFISEGCYAIAYTAHNPPQYTVKDYYSGFTAIPDHTGGTPGAMLFANGAPASNFVWKQTLTVLPNTTYLFSAWVSSGLNDPAPANLRFQVDTSAGCSGSSSFTGIGTLNANTAPGWVQGYATFRTGSSTSVCVGLLNQNSAANGNDFAIDDLSVDTDSRAPTASNATVSTPKGVAGTRNVVTSDVTAGSSPVNAASVDLDPAVIGRQTSWVFTNATGTVTFTVDTAGLVTFTPSANFLGTATCSWRVFTTDATPVPSNVATLSVTVSSVTPAPTASNTGPYCAGATISLSASTVAGATYAWTGPNSFTSSAQNPTIASATVAMAGTYSVTATVGGTISLPGTTTVVVNAVPSAPTASNTGPYAVGATISLSASTVAGATYAWTGPNGFTSSAQNPTIASATAAMAGTYSVTATAGGCASAAGTTVVTVNPYPAPTAYSVNPNAGALAGGTAVTISGTGFRMGVLVKFGANAGTLTSLSPTSVTVTTPAGAAAGSVTVTVRNTDGQTATAPAFTYNPSGCWPDASSEKSRMTGPCYPPVGGSPSSSSSTPLAVQTPNPTTFVGPAAWDSSSPDANTFIFFSGLPPVPTGAARGFAPRSVGVAPGEAITGCYRRMPAEGKMDVAVFQGGAAAPSSGGGPGTLAATGFGVAVTKYEGTTVVGQTKVEMASSKGNGVFDRIRIDGGELDLPIVTFDSNGDGVADYMSVPWGMLAAYGWSTDASGFIGNGGTPGPTPQIWMPLADTDGDGYGDSIVFDDGTGKPSTVFPKFPPMLPPFSQRNDLAVPALGEWGLFAFALSLAAAGWYAIRRTIG